MPFPFLPRIAIIAHRGASACAPENTLAAFELAIQQAADAIELDAKLTADGHVVVIHDQAVDR
jgi:glycerophosphoryl diester phosphodiesterase